MNNGNPEAVVTVARGEIASTVYALHDVAQLLATVDPERAERLGALVGGLHDLARELGDLGKPEPVEVPAGRDAHATVVVLDVHGRTFTAEVVCSDPGLAAALASSEGMPPCAGGSAAEICRGCGSRPSCPVEG